MPQGKHDDAMKEFMKAVKTAPGAPEPYTAIGHSLQEQNQLKKAEQSLKMALRFNPMYAPTWNILGEVHMSRLCLRVPCLFKALIVLLLQRRS